MTSLKEIPFGYISLVIYLDTDEYEGKLDEEFLQLTTPPQIEGSTEQRMPSAQ